MTHACLHKSSCLLTLHKPQILNQCHYAKQLLLISQTFDIEALYLTISDFYFLFQLRNFTPNFHSQTQLRFQVVVLLLRRLIARISPLRPGFNPRPFYVAWVVRKVAMRQVFVTVLLFPLSVIFHKFSFIIRTSATHIIIVLS